ncbi:hypothetical protein FRX31_008993 [Thalictrum thalictroides]|uniref:Uncharacterized protein n=1 Tax=Thalictrum thalictroides TaxID=46969 RepID=A0A7J6WY70_THATH|nr:hypothetical protein FRX31_008993 [Thalictrum thalictroides]
MKLMVQTSILSKRWKYVWTTSPYLIFENDLNWITKEEKEFMLLAKTKKEEEFMLLVNNVFFYRDRSVSIEKFKLVSTRKVEVDVNFLEIWLGKAIELNKAQEIHLNLSVNQKFELSDNLFDSELKVFKLATHLINLVRVPYSMCLSIKITVLDLRNVTFPDGGLDKALTISSPVLEDLKLCNIDYEHLNVLNILTPLLKRFE